MPILDDQRAFRTAPPEIFGDFISWKSPIPCPFFVGWLKRQSNPTHLWGYGFATLRERSDCSAFTQCPAGIPSRSTTQPTNQGFFRFG